MSEFDIAQAYFKKTSWAVSSNTIWIMRGATIIATDTKLEASSMFSPESIEKPPGLK